MLSFLKGLNEVVEFHTPGTQTGEGETYSREFSLSFPSFCSAGISQGSLLLAYWFRYLLTRLINWKRPETRFFSFRRKKKLLQIFCSVTLSYFFLFHYDTPTSSRLRYILLPCKPSWFIHSPVCINIIFVVPAVNFWCNNVWYIVYFEKSRNRFVTRRFAEENNCIHTHDRAEKTRRIFRSRFFRVSRSAPSNFSFHVIGPQHVRTFFFLGDIMANANYYVRLYPMTQMFV